MGENERARLNDGGDEEAGGNPAKASTSILDGTTDNAPQRHFGSVTGLVYVDLRDVAVTKMRQRLWAALSSAPTGSTVLITVGPCAAEPTAVLVLREFRHRLHLQLAGEPYAVRRWIDGVCNGLPGHGGLW